MCWLRVTASYNTSVITDAWRRHNNNIDLKLSVVLMNHTQLIYFEKKTKQQQHNKYTDSLL